ncbi:methylated-DNA--[protein]-cysteine S-methyltransferase [Hephaestia sp. GCM10023244]|uniref:methylated-DNA--[protein]-cysteine S-methyltransferase n=1 Tax=unclassified Hephaestia TaxID=2631281 RepID=UPI0020775B1B|nr:methylated-DNA--[protein]-cysteine S-methyltransferase [Hephaestia sp. MAHUQ-44]MCM8731149.1 methylated-DNA--[protein]-cysteine S-methyltransferase [Hephaestia sp. MAHUQ-44]
MYAQDQAVIATPIGAVRIIGDDRTIARIAIGGTAAPLTGHADAVRTAADQLSAWFAGRLTTFDLPLTPAATPRGQALRDAMIGIGYGETMSYGALARVANSGARAIGQACARNPFPIIVPCHRVLGAGGALGAYSAGEGPATKQWLLDHEHRTKGTQG